MSVQPEHQLDLSEELAFASEIAREAATIVTTFYVGSSEVEYKSHDEPVTEAQIAEKRRLANELREHPELLARTMEEAGRRLETIPVAAKGVRAGKRRAPGFLSGWLAALLRRVGRSSAAK